MRSMSGVDVQGTQWAKDSKCVVQAAESWAGEFPD